MQVISEKGAVRSVLDRVRSDGCSVGFVPTMGFLHEGHLSLVRAARDENDYVVVSIFVNPLQFGPSEDLKEYPRDLERDSKLLEEVGCDLLFHPGAEEMYAPGFCSRVQVSDLTETLCGAARPGHFDGVTTVVCKLLNIVKPHRAYFGEKDRQQLIVVRRMVIDLDIQVDIIGMPIIRDEDGLAMSSRNLYLEEDHRKRALYLNQALTTARRMVQDGERRVACIIEKMYYILTVTTGVEPEYVVAVDETTLAANETVAEGTIFAVAARVGEARLIDNYRVTEADLVTS